MSSTLPKCLRHCKNNLIVDYFRKVGELMKYKNGVKYTFTSDKFPGCVAHVTLHNFGKQAVENFNRALAEGMVKAYKEEVEAIEGLSMAH